MRVGKAGDPFRPLSPHTSAFSVRLVLYVTDTTVHTVHDLGAVHNKVVMAVGRTTTALRQPRKLSFFHPEYEYIPSCRVGLS